MSEPRPDSDAGLDALLMQDVWPGDEGSDAGLAQWQDVAEWLEAEAQAQPGPAQKADCWLVASELRAHIGDLSEARHVAALAEDAQAGAATTQSRQLALADHDLPAARDFVDRGLQQGETTATGDGSDKATVEKPDSDVTQTDGRSHVLAHLHFLKADLDSVALADAASASLSLQRAQHLLPRDPRPALFQFCRQFASQTPISVTWPATASGETLRRWAKELQQLWSGPDASDEPASSLVGLSWARRDLRLGNVDRALRHLAAVQTDPELGPSAIWARGTLWATIADGPKETLVAVRQAAERTPSLEGKRYAALLTAPADADAAQALVDKGLLDVDGALAHALLTQSVPITKGPFSAGLDFLGVLFGLAQEAELESATPHSPQLNLWLGLASGKDLGALTPWARATRELTSACTFSQFLDLEYRVATRGALADALVEFYGTHDARVFAARFVAGVAAESRSETSATPEAQKVAHKHYELALASPVFAEAALRALPGSPAEKRPLFQRVLDTVPAGPQRAFLAAEIALAALDANEAPQALESADATQAPIAQLITQYAAQVHAARTGDLGRWAHAVRERRRDTEAPAEEALLLLQECLLAGNESAGASALFTKAQACRPADLSIHLARCASIRPGLLACGSQVEDLARHTASQELKAALLLVAAWYRDIGFNPQHAARLAKESMDIAPSDLAQHTFERNAPGTELEPILLEQRARQVVSDAPKASRSSCALELAELARRRGERTKEGHWLREALRLSPRDISVLVQAEQHAFETGDHALLIEVERALFSVLPTGDGEPHLELAGRLTRLRQGGSAAYRLLRGAETPRLSIQAQREVQFHARRAKDHEVLKQVNLGLVTHAAGALDRSQLYYEAARAATEQGDVDQSLELLDHALTACPGNLLAHVLRGTWLAQQGNAAGAAEALESAAALCASKDYRAELLTKAGHLWEGASKAEQARTAFEAAFAQAPQSPEVLAALRTRYQEDDDPGALLALVRQALEHTADPKDRSSLRMQHARLLCDTGLEEEAIVELEALSQEHLHDAAASLLLAELLKDTAPERAERVLLEVTRRGGDDQADADAYLALARLYSGPLASPRRAERCYREVIKRRPTDAEALAALEARQD